MKCTKLFSCEQNSQAICGDTAYLCAYSPTPTFLTMQLNTQIVKALKVNKLSLPLLSVLNTHDSSFCQAPSLLCCHSSGLALSRLQHSPYSGCSVLHPPGRDPSNMDPCIPVRPRPYVGMRMMSLSDGHIIPRVRLIEFLAMF